MAAKNAHSDLTQTSNREQKLFNLTPVSRAVLMACGATLAVAPAPAVMAQEDIAL